MAPFMAVIQDETTDEQMHILKEINAILEKTTLDDPNIYVQTSAFFNTLRVHLGTKHPKSEGFIFTSVQYKEKQISGWNLVLNPETSTRICKVKSVFKRNMRILEVENQRFSVASLEDPIFAVRIDEVNKTIEWG